MPPDTATLSRRAARVATSTALVAPAPLMVIGSTRFLVSAAAAHEARGRDIDATIRFALGGPALDAAAVGVANNLQTALLTPHPVGVLADWATELVRSTGIVPLVVERRDPQPPARVELRTGRRDRGAYVHAALPVDSADLTPPMLNALQLAEVVAVGAVGRDGSVTRLLDSVIRHTPDAVRILVPDHAMVQSPGVIHRFPDFHYVQVDEGVARTLPNATRDIIKNSLRLRYLANERREIAVIPTLKRGWLWSDYSWWLIDGRHRINRHCSATSLVFAVAFMVGRHFYSLSPASAIEYAQRSADHAADRTRALRALSVSKMLGP